MQNSGIPSNSLPVPEGFGKSGLNLSDAEVICTFMEPDAPANGGRPNIDVLKKFSPQGWWRYSTLSCNWKQPIFDACPKVEKLGRLHEVEARLDRVQVAEYSRLLWDGRTSFIWHTSAEQKITALAATLRPRVLPKDDTEGAQAYKESKP